MATAGCGDPAGPDAVPTGPEGVWAFERPPDELATLRLEADGRFDRVTVDFTAETCTTESGSWSQDADGLGLTVTALEGEPVSNTVRYDLLTQDGRATPVDGTVAGVLQPPASMPVCPDYGFGVWDGVIEAEVDGAPVVFTVVSVRADVDGGRVQIDAEQDGCPTCPNGDPVLSLLIESGGGRIDAGSFTVQNVPGADRTFYALLHPEPDASDFSGFDTSRRSPPGSFALARIATVRVVGAFEFRANPRVEGQAASDGASFTLVTDGRVDLTYLHGIAPEPAERAGMPRRQGTIRP